MNLYERLILVNARGLGRVGLQAAREGFGRVGGPGGLTGKERAALLAEHGWAPRRGTELAWPDEARTRETAERMQRRGVDVAFIHTDGYPERLADRMGRAAPAWVLVAGERSRTSRPQCAVIGSRAAEPKFLGAAEGLGRALAKAGYPVTSGMARGSDSAAHRGAEGGRAGTIALPARGLLEVVGRLSEQTRRQTTLIGLGSPEASFQAGLAIRRNYAIAALADALVLVASGLKGGSAYAVKRAIERRIPVWCFEAGSATTPGNRALINSGAAKALTLGEQPEAWAERIGASIERAGAKRARRTARGNAQLDLFG